MKTPTQEIAYFYNEIKVFSELVQFSERVWPEELAKYQISLADENEKYGDRYDFRTDLSSKLSSEFPQTQRRAYLVMLLALLEDFLNQLCLSVQESQRLSKSLFDIKGKGIERAKKYLTENSRITLPFQSREWQSIKNSQSVRNIIVHSAGHLDLDKHKKTISIVSAAQNLESEPFARVHLVIKESYILELTSDIEVFCENLLTQFGINA
ncbi:hypothetical protein Q4583_03990 [Neptunomonas phycophila]|uniref:hypothetical protein n=1 Tax=Neptunomonas phycophila TaxID=1572645 RepID=UPI0026E175F0|nr:hypothetical protein [Neptunomonas phycophila]MDO6783264.1 hypothetical protein [Neptunomonas phycophila]